jgi:hypothetical protein
MSNFIWAIKRELKLLEELELNSPLLELWLKEYEKIFK